VPHTVRAFERRSSPPEADAAASALAGPVAAGVGLKVQRTELVNAEDLFGIALAMR
jgi:hypothetical protein